MLDRFDSIIFCNLEFNLIGKNLERCSEFYFFIFFSFWAQFHYNRHQEALILPPSPNSFSKTPVSYFKRIYWILSEVSLDACTIIYKKPHS